jgi:hypothetical protein
MLKRLALAVSALFAGMYVFTALPRLFYPHDLDFLENNSLMQALRFAQGQPVYASPSADFVATIYTPFYTWLGSLAFHILPPGLLPLRLISFYATLLTAVLIGHIAYREARQRWLALACAGLYLGGYRLTGFWYDLARVDSLALMLVMLGLTLGIYAQASRYRLALSAVTLALAFFTKQTALAFGVAFLLYGVLRIPYSVSPPSQIRNTQYALRFTFYFILPFILLILLPLFTAHCLTDNWFFFYVFTAASADATDLARAWRYLGLELLGVMLPLSALALLVAWRMRLRQPWLLMTLTAALVSGVGRASVGGNLNNLMPVYALLCLAPALLPPLQWSQLAPLALLLQLALAVYNPLRYIPTPTMLEQGNALIKQIHSINGPVLVMIQPYYAWRAGHTPSAQVASLWHLQHWLGLPWPADLVHRLQNRYYAAIISDESLFETNSPIHPLLITNYPHTQTLTAPTTFVGLPVRPTTLYLP